MNKNLEKKNNIIFGTLFSFFFFLAGLSAPTSLLKIKIFFIILSILILIITIYKPNYFYFFNKQWVKLGTILGKFFSPIILFIIFFFIITPIGILLKVFNKDPMGLKKKESYWLCRKDKPQTMNKQF
jgi:hypothetical protein